jgi:hypothetical protein
VLVPPRPSGAGKTLDPNPVFEMTSGFSNLMVCVQEHLFNIYKDHCASGDAAKHKSV